MTTDLMTCTLSQSPALRQPAGLVPTLPTPVQTPSGAAQMLPAFRHLGVGTDEQTAQTRSNNWYRSSGTAWTQGLD